MATTIAQVKPLKGNQAEKFVKAFETSGIKKEAASKSITAMRKGFTRKWVFLFMSNNLPIAYFTNWRYKPHG